MTGHSCFVCSLHVWSDLDHTNVVAEQDLAILFTASLIHCFINNTLDVFRQIRITCAYYYVNQDVCSWRFSLLYEVCDIKSWFFCYQLKLELDDRINTYHLRKMLYVQSDWYQGIGMKYIDTLFNLFFKSSYYLAIRHASNKNPNHNHSNHNYNHNHINHNWI